MAEISCIVSVYRWLHQIAAPVPAIILFTTTSFSPNIFGWTLGVLCLQDATSTS